MLEWKIVTRWPPSSIPANAKQIPADIDKCPLPFGTDINKKIIEARYGSIRTFSEFIELLRVSGLRQVLRHITVSKVLT